jgi:aryl-alcohol dehydrogenase-like predicted oxidoreductase
MGMSAHYGAYKDPASIPQSISTIHHALDQGVNFLDSSDSYGQGANEELIGQALKGRREKAILATKFGIVWDTGGPSRGTSGEPSYVVKCCEDSLRRLDTDVIDLFYMHRMDPDTPIEDTVGALSRLIEQGKVRYLGLSECGADTLKRAHATHPITALQTEYSLWSREPENEMIPLCRKLGIGYVAYSPLGRGFLTASVQSRDELMEDDSRRNMPRFSDENFDLNKRLLKPLKEISQEKECTPAQIALAWVLAQDENIIPIPGTKQKKYLEQNMAAVEITLSKENLDQLHHVFKNTATAGTRYAAPGLKELGI